jgi:hypothetical protein
MSSTILRRKLLTLLSDHSRLLRGFLHQPRILRGSFHQVYTRCGKPNCWCAKARKGHPHARLTWSEEGTNVTRKVPAGESKPVIKLTENYRQFREQRGQLTALELKIQDRLDQYEKALIEEVRKPLSFLAIPPRLSVRNTPALQTRQPRRKQPM